MTARRVRVPRRVPPFDSGSGKGGTDAPVVLGGRYELGGLIGVGGVAQVFRARDLLLHREVAVKLLGPGIDPSASERERVEMRTLAGLSHENLVTLHDAGSDHDHTPTRAYLVMALVDGLSLAQRLQSGPLPEAQLRDLGAQVADALAYVHSRGVVHRDVKPANILLDGSGRPYLTDFGIARAVGAAALTAVGDTVGTAAYLSPEQVRGQEVGPASDVYALGLVLLEALTGVREYPGTTAETAVARLTRQPRLDETLPADWRELLTEMTATEPAARPSAEQVASRLSGRPDTGATRVLATAPAAPAVDGTRLLTTAMSAGGRADDVIGRAVRRGPQVVRGAWSRLLPWASERRNQVAAALVVLAVLVLGLVVVSSLGTPGPGATVVPAPAVGPPGPSRLAPDLARLHQLVQP